MMNVFDPELFSKLQSVGKNVRIGSHVKIVFPENLSIGNNVIIDDFTFIYPGADSQIGDHVHIASFCCISGGGRFVLSDFSGLSGRVTLYTGTDDFSGESLTNPTVPLEFRKAAHIDEIRIGRHAIVGAGSTLLPGSHLGDGVAVGAMSFVRKPVESWTIVSGNPARKVGTRRQERILEMEQELRELESRSRKNGEY